MFSESKLASVPELLERQNPKKSCWLTWIHCLEHVKFSELISTKSLKCITGLEETC